MGDVVMAKEADTKAPVEIIPSFAGTVSAIASAHAPFLYFEAAPTFGYLNGIVQITLVALRPMPGPTGLPVSDQVVVGHLRMTAIAANALKAAIDGALLLAQPAAEM